MCWLSPATNSLWKTSHSAFLSAYRQTEFKDDSVEITEIAKNMGVSLNDSEGLTKIVVDVSRYNEFISKVKECYAKHLKTLCLDHALEWDNKDLDVFLEHIVPKDAHRLYMRFWRFKEIK